MAGANVWDVVFGSRVFNRFEDADDLKQECDDKLTRFRKCICTQSLGVFSLLIIVCSIIHMYTYHIAFQSIKVSLEFESLYKGTVLLEIGNAYTLLHEAKSPSQGFILFKVSE